MNIRRFENIVESASFFLAGGIFLLAGVATALDHTARESPIALLKTGAILFPLALLIGIATKKIFDHFRWQSKTAQFLIIHFAYISSTVLASVAAVGCGLTVSLLTGWKVAAIANELLIGAICVIMSVENICFGKNRVWNFLPNPILSSQLQQQHLPHAWYLKQKMLQRL